MHNVRVIKRYDLRPVDFDTGKRLAIPSSEWLQCQCCGRKIVKINQLNNGDVLGSECVEILDRTRYGRIPAQAFGMSKKQILYFEGLQEKE